MKMSWRRLWSSSSEDVFKTSSSRPNQDQQIRLGHTSSRRLQDVFKTFSRRLQDVFKTFSRRLHNVLKTSSRHLQDVFKMFGKRLQDVFKTSSRHIQDVLKTSSKYLQDVFKTYHQVKVFLATQFQDIFETYSKRFWDVLLRRLSTGGLPRSHFWEIYGQCTKFQKVINFSSFNFSLYYTF